MFRMSRMLTALVVLAALWFFWPFGGEKNVVEIETPQEPVQDGTLFTKPLRETPPDDAAPQTKPASSDKAGEQETAVVDAKVNAKGDDGAPKATANKPVLKPKRFYRVVVRDGGSLKSGGVTIALDGIKPQGLSDTCEDAQGEAWPCGRYARAALIRLIRGRAVTCQVPISGAPKDLSARCSIGDTDLSVWMVRQGWAKPASQSDPALITAADTARKRKLGIWR